MSRILLRLIDVYQRYLSFDRGILMFLAPGGACKFSPTCSEYMKIMIKKEGTVRGICFGLRRFISCR